MLATVTGDGEILPLLVGTVADRGEGLPQQSVAQCKFFTVDFPNSYLYSLVCLSTSMPWLGIFCAGQGLPFDKVANTLITRYLINSSIHFEYPDDVLKTMTGGRCYCLMASLAHQGNS